MRRNYLESNFYRYSEKFRFRERRERVLFSYNGYVVYFQIPCLYIYYGILWCQNECFQFSVCLFMYETEVLRAGNLFSFLFVVVFLREVSLKIATDCLQLVFQRG